MPILDIDLVQSANESIPEGLARDIADAVGALYGVTAGEVWVRLRRIDAAHYAENGTDHPPQPVIVQLLTYTLPPTERRDALGERLCEDIARLCGKPVEQVHLLWLPEAKGRMYFGGKPAE